MNELDLINFLEWLDGNRVVRQWDESSATHEDVARLFLSERGDEVGTRIVVTRSRKGFQWAQIARNGSAGAISPKTYDTKSNAMRAARRQAALVGGVVEVR